MMRRSRRAGMVLAVLGVFFDTATILPALAGGYTLKRSVGFDLIPHYDTLPDDVIEPVLRWMARRVAHDLGEDQGAGG